MIFICIMKPLDLRRFKNQQRRHFDAVVSFNPINLPISLNLLSHFLQVRWKEDMSFAAPTAASERDFRVVCVEFHINRNMPFVSFRNDCKKYDKFVDIHKRVKNLKSRSRFYNF
ncbi:hypothetical protein PUN28_004678 [Cardiocondyla obscurior]|uniref:Uncharacterized protein n=1 Tax=Cardiocondyla obscurior TaxID=286306 RepID=A0AAW2GDZ5_9HYME